MSSPEDDPSLVPIMLCDITRWTKTDFENSDEVSMNDVSCGGAFDMRELSDFRVGETMCAKLLRAVRHRLPSPPVHSIAKSSQSGDIWPEVWKWMNKKQKKASIVERGKTSKEVNTVRGRRGISADTDEISFVGLFFQPSEAANNENKQRTPRRRRLLSCSGPRHPTGVALALWSSIWVRAVTFVAIQRMIFSA